jgi:hypothetical protein
MTTTLRAPVLASLLAFAMLFAFALPATAQPTTELTQEVTGAVTDAATGDIVGDFVGELDITSITRDGDQLVFGGTLSGDVLDEAGNVVDTLEPTDFEVVGDLTSATEGNGNRCDILFLDLGPINLDVLGLVVDLSDVQLDVFAVPGAGNLLGNLLCAVAGLLDGPGLLGQLGNAIDALLDRITGLLG